MTGTGLTLRNLTKKFGATIALNDFNLEIEQGQLVSLLGPSGCGKTTALRIVAGLEKEDNGEIILGERDITQIPAHLRNMGMVFQAYSLFPNLTAAENVGFGLHMRKVKNHLRSKKVLELLQLVGLDYQADRYPHQLSGGQQQRVALARALAYQPEILLLDEPLSALDAQVRANLRDEIRRLQIELGTTTLFVTHDQEEAMSISDRVGVMNSGSLEQIGTPDQIYDFPKTAFVASFVGLMNKIPTQARNGSVELFGKTVTIQGAHNREGSVVALVRPEKVTLSSQSVKPNATIINRSFLGASSKIICKTNQGVVLQSLMPSHESEKFHPGSQVEVSIDLEEVLVSHE